ncbi:MAG: DNA-binding protein [Aggregatilineales bacterium]
MTGITARQVNPAGTRVFMGTLTDKAELHPAFVKVAQEMDIQTATFEMLGGLHEVEFSAYDFVKQVHQEPIIVSRAMEIVAGHGTISLLDGAPHVHMHLAVAFRDGNAPQDIRVVGGHAARAVAFAVEFTLTAYDGSPAERAPHPSTGLRLWNFPRIS